MSATYRGVLLASAVLLHSPHGNAEGPIQRACSAKIVETVHGVEFSGCISEESKSRLLNAIERHRGQRVIFTSEGGAVGPAIDIGEHFNKYKVQVLFRDKCNSSCANYILPASIGARIAKGLSVVMHGDVATSLLSVRAATLPREAIVAYEALREREIFLKEIPSVKRILTLQRIALAPKGLQFKVSLNGKDLICQGMGLNEWQPSERVLTELGIQITDQDPEIKSGSKTRHTLERQAPTVNPMESCRQ